jgi:hypothetical protein
MSKRRKNYDDDWGLISYAEFEEMDDPTEEQTQAMQEIMGEYERRQRIKRAFWIAVLLLIIILAALAVGLDWLP